MAAIGWTKNHAAPTFELSALPPKTAVFPSDERATDQLWIAFPTAPVPTSLGPCWVQTPTLRVYTQAAPSNWVS